MDSKLYLAENVLNERRLVRFSHTLQTSRSLLELGHVSLIEPRVESTRRSGQTVCSTFATMGIGFGADIDTLLHSILFEFHRNENAKKPKTVHATYVISGIQKAPEPTPTNGHADDEDEMMQSSPYSTGSLPDEDASDSIRTTSIILAREEDLEGTQIRLGDELITEGIDQMRKQHSSRYLQFMSTVLRLQLSRI